MAASTPTTNSPSDWSSPFEQFLGDRVPTIQEAPHQFGTPDTDKVFWDGQQSYPDTCAIRCQEFILEQFSGQQISEDALVQQAIDHGWYQPGGGTQGQDIGNLLELNGVPVTRYQDASIFNLSNELAQGHKVIVGVDSGELWHRNAVLDGISDALGLSGADHAIVVSGIDTRDPNHVQVIVSDPGTGEVAASYPLEQFVDAWQDSGCYMVATQNPAPHWAPEMARFDYAQGHIDQVWGLDYNDFLGLADQPQLWSDYLERALDASDTAQDGFGATAAGDPAAETGHPSFLTGNAAFPTTLPDLVDCVLRACHPDPSGDDLQPEGGHHSNLGDNTTDFDGNTNFDSNNV